MRIVHVIAEFSAREAMGRTVVETVERVDAEHHLVTTVAHDGTDRFASVTELGGSVATFPLGRTDDLRSTLEGLEADVVHLHAGALGPFQAMAALRGLPTVMTIYAWPTLPGPKALRRVSYAQLRASNVLQARVALTTLVPRRLAGAALARAGVQTVLSPDPRVLDRLDGRTGPVAVRLPSGGPTDSRRARHAAADGGGPTVVFAGRAESVRGLDTLLAAFPAVLRAVPDARLRLLLIPRAELPEILERAGASALGDALEIVTEPVPDLAAELAAAQVGCWPFLFDYTTSPPAMAVAEAMSVGLPVVSTDVACVRAAIRDERDGILVPAGDSDALARELVTLLTDRAEWDRLAAAGPESVLARLSWERTAEVTSSAYAAA